MSRLRLSVEDVTGLVVGLGHEYQRQFRLPPGRDVVRLAPAQELPDRCVALRAATSGCKVAEVDNVSTSRRAVGVDPVSWALECSGRVEAASPTL